MSAQVRALLADASQRLAKAGVPSPQADAELLLAHAVGASRSQLTLLARVASAEQVAFEELITRRCNREPLQHLTGEAHFRHLTLQVGPGVFVPRPETETLVQLALDDLAAISDHTDRPLVVVDLCTGSAAIPLSIATELGGVTAIGLELSDDAYAWAERNVAANGAALERARSSVELKCGDARQAAGLLPGYLGKVDVLTCNPPYIPDAAIPRDPEVRDFDPAVALYGGPDGLDVVRDVVAEAVKLLRPGGLLLIEHGDEQGHDAGSNGVPGVLNSQPSLVQIGDVCDLAGRPRVTSARRSSVD